MAELDLKAFAGKVLELLELQQKFFKQHDSSVVAECKRREKELLSLCREILDDQPKLFR